MSAATIGAIHEDRVVSLLIVAAGVSVSLAGFGWMVDRRLGDAHDSGKLTERRALARDLAGLVERAD